MKNKDFVKLALVEINKIYKIRKEIILQQFKRKYDNPEMKKRFYYNTSFFNKTEISPDEGAYREIEFSIDSIIIIRNRFFSWASAGVGHNRDDKVVTIEIKKVIQRIDEIVNNRFTDYKFDSLLEEAKSNLENLIVLSELVN